MLHTIHSIAYSLSNISAKNYRNRLMWVESIVCNISVVFLGHSVEWLWQIRLAHLNPVWTSSDYCMILCMINYRAQTLSLLSEVEEIKFPYDRSYFWLCY